MEVIAACWLASWIPSGVEYPDCIRDIFNNYHVLIRERFVQVLGKADILKQGEELERVEHPNVRESGRIMSRLKI